MIILLQLQTLHDAPSKRSDRSNIQQSATQQKKQVDPNPFHSIDQMLPVTRVSNIGPTSFVPVEDHVVPTHASYSNKLNDSIGTLNADLVGPGGYEVVIPSDWYMSRTLPTEFDGAYWPSGSIQPDFLYPGSNPKQPLRNQGWNAAFTNPALA